MQDSAGQEDQAIHARLWLLGPKIMPLCRTRRRTRRRGTNPFIAKRWRVCVVAMVTKPAF